MNTQIQAKARLTSSVNFDALKKDGCPGKVVNAFKDIAQHTKMVYAQYETDLNIAQCLVIPASDSASEHGAKVFSLPEFLEISQTLRRLSEAAPGIDIEFHVTTDHPAGLTIVVAVESDD